MVASVMLRLKLSSSLPPTHILWKVAYAPQLCKVVTLLPMLVCSDLDEAERNKVIQRPAYPHLPDLRRAREQIIELVVGRHCLTPMLRRRSATVFPCSLAKRPRTYGAARRGGPAGPPHCTLHLHC